MLHPQARTWADILELYGPNTKPDRRSNNEAILDAQTRHSNSVKTGLIRLLKSKMLEIGKQWVGGCFSKPLYALFRRCLKREDAKENLTFHRTIFLLSTSTQIHILTYILILLLMPLESWPSLLFLYSLFINNYPIYVLRL